MEEILKLLKNPPKEYRAVPFWSWNDKLNPEFLRWQIREMDKAGLGGYFMHARGGLQTEYLSEEWMKCIEACIDEGKKLGMNSWCYDEEGWPSGFAGGIVTALGDKYHVRWLEYEEICNEDISGKNEILGLYKYNIETDVIEQITVENIDFQNIKLIKGSKYIIVRNKSNPYYIDILNEEVIKAFIESTHEKYYEKFKEEFGKAMPGFFTDEPQFCRGQIPWSYILPDRFMKKYNYDLIKVLPALFIECQGYEKVRYDFWNLVSELYVTSFGEQIYKWCEEHNCKLTGHVMMEDDLFSQMNATAGAMPFYEYMHTPGIDWLGRAIPNQVIPKQVSSVACQLGKKFVLSETFALCGWDVSFEELKWIGEWQYVNGVNLMCQHLEGYTLRGLRKRDYPPSLFYQQSWWEEYGKFNDYFARLGILLTSGKSGAEVLLLHPIKSAWIAYNHSRNDTIQKLDEDFQKTTELLSGLHVEHHYGDETIIKRHGRVEGSNFIIGQCKYKLIIMPSMINVDENTMELLNEFIDNGGKVISTGDFPRLSSGVPSSKIQILRDKVLHVSENCMYNEIKKYYNPSISVSDGNRDIKEIHHMERDLEDSKIYFLVNHDTDKSFKSVIRLNGIGNVKKIVAENGETVDIEYKHTKGYTEIELEFLPRQSHVIMFSLQENLNNSHESQGFAEIEPEKSWNIEAMDYNSLTLDYCSYSIDDGEWSKSTPVIKLMDILLNLKRSCNIAMKFNFEVDMNLKNNKEFYLVVENADEFEIIINNNKIHYKEEGWWKDSTFKKVDIKSYVCSGNNEIILKREFHQDKKVYDVLFGENVLETEINKLTYDVELESIYVVGDFGVRSKSEYSYGERKAIFTEGPFVIEDKPKKITDGELTTEGFCFFAGAVKLSQNLSINKHGEDKVILKLNKPNAVVSKIYINDEPIKTLLWAPYCVDITDCINEGKNKLTLELFAGNRNLLGPHHHVLGELYYVGPSSFTDKQGWAEGSIMKDIWRDRYCFVKFGLEKK